MSDETNGDHPLGTRISCPRCGSKVASVRTGSDTKEFAREYVRAQRAALVNDPGDPAALICSDCAAVRGATFWIDHDSGRGLWSAGCSRCRDAIVTVSQNDATDEWMTNSLLNSIAQHVERRHAEIRRPGSANVAPRDLERVSEASDEIRSVYRIR